MHSDEHNLVGERVKYDLTSSVILSEYDADGSPKRDEENLGHAGKNYKVRKPRPKDLI